jgi:hypothetical protein
MQSARRKRNDSVPKRSACLSKKRRRSALRRRPEPLPVKPESRNARRRWNKPVGRPSVKKRLPLAVRLPVVPHRQLHLPLSVHPPRTRMVVVLGVAALSLQPLPAGTEQPRHAQVPPLVLVVLTALGHSPLLEEAVQEAAGVNVRRRGRLPPRVEPRPLVPNRPLLNQRRRLLSKTTMVSKLLRKSRRVFGVLHEAVVVVCRLSILLTMYMGTKHAMSYSDQNNYSALIVWKFRNPDSISLSADERG